MAAEVRLASAKSMESKPDDVDCEALSSSLACLGGGVPEAIPGVLSKQMRAPPHSTGWGYAGPRVL